MSLTIIAAVGRDGAIGRGGDLAYHISADLRRFKALTMGHSLIMGRRTFLSLPGGALPGRRNIVLTRDPGFSAPGVETAPSLADAVAVAAVRNRSIDLLRRRAVRTGTGTVDASEAELHADDRTDTDDTFARVRAVIDTVLSPRDADILVLRDYRGYEIGEIAARHGLQEANVRMILSRSRRAVRDAYLKYYRL